MRCLAFFNTDPVEHIETAGICLVLTYFCYVYIYILASSSKKACPHLILKCSNGSAIFRKTGKNRGRSREQDPYSQAIVVCTLTRPFYVNGLEYILQWLDYTIIIFSKKGSTSIYHVVFWIKAIFRLRPAIVSLESLQILLNQFPLFVKMFLDNYLGGQLLVSL